MKGFFIITDTVLYISILSALISALIYSRLNHSNRYFAIYLVLGAVIELFSVSFSESGKNNLIFFHLNAIIEFGILTLFFDILFKEKEGKSIKEFLLPGIVLIVFNSLVIQKVDTYNSISLTVVSIYLIGCCLYYFYLIMGNQNASAQPRFQKFAVFSIFVLHNISLMVLFFGNYLLSVNENIQMTIWSTRAMIILLVKMVILFEIFMLARSFYFVKESNHG